MIALFWFVFWAGLSLLVAAAGVTLYARRTQGIMARGPRVDDDVIARIIDHGEIFFEDDEPLDLDEIDEEEQRFWSDSWDEPTDPT
ncbi:MAG: hypothetical protein O2958_10865 [Gemmatimonadetes bacterium]|nr:hypothetical protein [Gemmatimonadota bacterium]MDA1104483.1 hypothetical protein [Gemmatimonadota bacterium]